MYQALLSVKGLGGDQDKQESAYILMTKAMTKINQGKMGGGREDTVVRKRLLEEVTFEPDTNNAKEPTTG